MSIAGDGSYYRPPWVAPPEAAYPPQGYLGPFASNQERMLSQALASQTMQGAQLQEYVRPPLPQIELFPARYGYVKDALRIDDIIDITSRAYETERVDTPNAANTPESTQRNSLGWGV